MTLDQLRAAVRHYLIAAVLPAVAAAILHVTGAVTTAAGVTSVAWSTVLVQALDTAALALASGTAAWLALYATPLTKQYGFFSKTEVTEATTQDPWSDDEPEQIEVV